MKTPKQPTWNVGTLEEKSSLSFGGGVCIFFIVIGALWVMMGTIIETSAVRSAASGAFWTGWNVMWGIGALLGRRRHYTVISFDAPTLKT
jgi:hypothetical protein